MAVCFLNYPQWPLSRVRCPNWRDTRRISLRAVLQWIHGGDEMRKLKKELVHGVSRTNNTRACNATFNGAGEACFNSDVFSAAVQPREKSAHTRVLA